MSEELNITTCSQCKKERSFNELVEYTSQIGTKETVCYQCLYPWRNAEMIFISQVLRKRLMDIVIVPEDFHRQLDRTNVFISDIIEWISEEIELKLFQQVVVEETFVKTFDFNIDTKLKWIVRYAARVCKQDDWYEQIAVILDEIKKSARIGLHKSIAGRMLERASSEERKVQ